MKNTIVILCLLVGLGLNAQTLSTKRTELSKNAPSVEKPSVEKPSATSLKSGGTNVLSAGLKSQANSMIQSLTSQLGLNATQVTQVTSIIGSLLTNTSSLKDLAGAQLKSKMNSLVLGADDKIKGLLNADQLSKFTSVAGLLKTSKVGL